MQTIQREFPHVGAAIATAVIALVVLATVACPKPTTSGPTSDSGEEPTPLALVVPDAGLEVPRYKQIVLTPPPPPPPPDSPAPTGRTEPTTWAKDGWQTLRWGMGPADVNERLRDPKGVVRATRNLDCDDDDGDIDDCYLRSGSSAFTLLNSPVKGPDCQFRGGRLVEVTLDLNTKDAEAAARNFNDLRELLRTKYGRESPLKKKDDFYAAWDPPARATAVDLFVVRHEDHWSVVIQYRDAAELKGSNSDWKRMEGEKL